MAIYNKTETDIFCTKCGEKQYPNMTFCYKCGAKLNKPKVCPACKNIDKYDAVYCKKCGTLLH